ncbi:MAG: hypothetical protein DESF_00758 [Desulfovibrio sp.]
MREQLKILVTGVGGGGHGEQILKAIKLSSLDCTLIGTDITPSSSGFEIVDKSHILPPAKDASYLSKLLELCDHYKVDVLFHGSEPELNVIAANRPVFLQRGIFLPINPDAVIETCMDKVKTASFLTQNGFKTPYFTKVTTLRDVANFPIFPAVIKPSIGGGGSAFTGIAQAKEEAIFLAQQILEVHGQCILQEYVGTPDDEYTVGVLLDMDGILINSIVVHRFIMSALSNRFKIPNTSGRRELGPTLAISSGISQGWIGPHKEIQRECERIALALGAKGAINIQCRFVNDKVIPFEINPRFSGTTSLRALVGYNEPEVLIRKHIFGEAIPQHFPYASGVITRSLHEHFYPDLKD